MIRFLELFLNGLYQRAGYDVIAAEDGARAVRELDKEDPPRLALLDCVMPGLDGAEICRELRTR
jgi:DNA-binding response OmpR family regulator